VCGPDQLLLDIFRRLNCPRFDPSTRFPASAAEGEQIVKTFVCLAPAAGTFASPALWFTQSADNTTYPADAQAAETKAAAQDAPKQAVSASGGMAEQGSAQSGTAPGPSTSHSLYFGQWRESRAVSVAPGCACRVTGTTAGHRASRSSPAPA
jgi:hypothetical protein